MGGSEGLASPSHGKTIARVVRVGRGLTLVAHVGSRDADILTAGDHDLLSKESLLGNKGREATHKVSLGINNNDFLKPSIDTLLSPVI